MRSEIRTLKSNDFNFLKTQLNQIKKKKNPNAKHQEKEKKILQSKH